MIKGTAKREQTRQAILKASLELIYEKGYEAMGLRDLAKKVGLQPASIYNYIQEKEDILFFLVQEALERRLTELRADVAAAGEDPVAQIRAYVALNVTFHTDRSREMVIGNEQIKSLSKPRFDLIVAIRDQFESVLEGIIRRGNERGLFRVTNVRLAVFAIISLISGISRWYSPGGALSPRQISDEYQTMVLSLLRFERPPDAAS